MSMNTSAPPISAADPASAAAPCLTLEAAYRYLNLGDAASGDLVTYTGTNTVNNPMEFRDIVSHDVKLGVRYVLN